MLLPKRIWKDIPGYEGLYQVSNTGQVRSLDNKKTIVVKQSTLKRGYKSVCLKKNKTWKTYLVHRLVAQAFIPNPNNWPQVNHKDENPSNNAVWNLEWCTNEYNYNYGNHRENLKRIAANKAKPILMFTKDGQFIRRFDGGVAEANEYLGKDRNASNIYNCLRDSQQVDSQRTAYGYIWKYEMEG